MYRVMLVDDEQIILSGLKSLINWEELGLDVPDSAAGAEEALARMRDLCYDILITDLRMLGMSGLEMIAEIRRLGYPVKILVISGYGNFDNLKIAIRHDIEDFLLKPVDEDQLKTAVLYILEKMESERRQKRYLQVMNSIVLDNILNSWIAASQEDAQLIEKLEILQVCVDKPYYRACVIRLKYPPQCEPPQVSSREIQGMFRQRCRCGETLYATFSLCGDIILIFAGSEMPESGRMLAFLDHAMGNALFGAACSYTAAVGRPVQDAMQVHKSYCSALPFLLFGNLVPGSLTVVYDLWKAQSAKLLAGLSLEEAWLGSFLHCDENALLCRLETLHEKLQALRDRPTEFQSQALMNVAYFLIAGVETLRVKNARGEPLGWDLHALASLSCYEARLAALEDAVIELSAKYVCRRDLCHPLVDKLKEIVKTCYATELSLKTLALDLGVSQTYLGRIFKKNTNALFTEYLSNYRIEKAKEYLLTTSLRSADIAKKVGFGNPNYFSNVFKKREGIYPTQYRRQNGTL